jgi:hypothetical protein
MLLYDLGNVVAAQPLLVGPLCLFHVLFRRPLRVRNPRFFERIPKGIRARKSFRRQLHESEQNGEVEEVGAFSSQLLDELDVHRFADVAGGMRIS